MKDIDVKTVITLVALVLWIATTVYGFVSGDFSTVFDFFKEVFMMIISFYLGTKAKENK